MQTSSGVKKSQLSSVQMSQLDNTLPAEEVAGTTKFGKEIKISRKAGGRKWVITVAGGGIQPPELGGLWSYEAAKFAIELYQSKVKTAILEE